MPGGGGGMVAWAFRPGRFTQDEKEGRLRAAFFLANDIEVW
jgi:hypothetical protein